MTSAGLGADLTSVEAVRLSVTLFNTSASITIDSIRAVPTPSAVPEPGTWLLMLTGLGAVGIARRRSRAPRG